MCAAQPISRPESPYGAAIEAAVEELRRAEAIVESAKTRLSGAEAERVQLRELVRSLIARLPRDQQALYQQMLDAASSQPIAANTRTGETLNNVIHLFATENKPLWTAAEVQISFAEKFGAIDPKAIYNALNYLERSGRLRRVTRGRYLDLEHGVGVELSDDLPTSGPEKGGVMED